MFGQNRVYDEDLRSLTPKTKNWGNNHLSRRFGRYSFIEFMTEKFTRFGKGFFNQIIINFHLEKANTLTSLIIFTANSLQIVVDSTNLLLSPLICGSIPAIFLQFLGY